MRFVNFGLILLLTLATIVGCSTTDSGSDLLNQAITTPPNSTKVAAVSQPMGNSSTKEDNSDLIDDSLPAKKIATRKSIPNKQLQVVKVSPATIVPLKQSTMVADSQIEGRAALAPVPTKIIAESHQYTVLKVDKKTIPERTVWKIYLGDKVISNTLERWAEEGGYQLVWKSQHDFEITSEATINGNMREAFNQVLLSFVDTSTPIKAIWYKNKVIVITSFSE